MELMQIASRIVVFGSKCSVAMCSMHDVTHLMMLEAFCMGSKMASRTYYFIDLQSKVILKTLGIRAQEILYYRIWPSLNIE